MKDIFGDPKKFTVTFAEVVMVKHPEGMDCGSRCQKIEYLRSLDKNLLLQDIPLVVFQNQGFTLQEIFPEKFKFDSDYMLHRHIYKFSKLKATKELSKNVFPLKIAWVKKDSVPSDSVDRNVCFNYLQDIFKQHGLGGSDCIYIRGHVFHWSSFKLVDICEGIKYPEECPTNIYF